MAYLGGEDTKPDIEEGFFWFVDRAIDGGPG